eukprot:SAG11_NODE_235_length_11852_cov_4.266020_17_plen_71_part_00
MQRATSSRYPSKIRGSLQTVLVCVDLSVRAYASEYTTSKIGTQRVHMRTLLRLSHRSPIVVLHIRPYMFI